MSLSSIAVSLEKRIKDVSSTSSKFATLVTEEEKVAFCLNLFREELNNLPLERIGKCSEKSRKLRETGNEHFKKNDLWKSVILYSESAAHAPPDSEELALAVGNRAAALIHLNMIREALTDVENALTMNISQNFRHKMLERKGKCLRMGESLPSASSFNFECDDLRLSSRKSSYFSSASSLVSPRYDENFGRFLVADDQVQTGQILIVEKPFSSVVIPNHFYTHCSWCFTRSFNLLPCPSCTTAMYCGEKCIEQSKSSHRIQCKTLDVLTNLEATTMELLSVKVLSDASQQGEKLNELISQISNCDSNNNTPSFYDSKDHMNIYKLICNTEKRTNSDLFHKCLTSCIILSALIKFTNLFDAITSDVKEHFIHVVGALILRYLQIMPCNAHEISEYCDGNYEEIGGGIYATLSLINHSCDPNVVRHCYNDVIVLRAIRPIKKGEQLFDNYGYHYALLSFNERQTSLYKQYYFKCQCEACIKNWPLVHELPEENPKFRKGIDLKKYEMMTEEFKKNIEDIFRGECDTEIVNSLMEYLNFLDEFVERPWKTYNFCQEAIKHCLGLWGNRFSIINSKTKVPLNSHSAHSA